MLGHTLMSAEESLRDFTKFADFATIVEETDEEELLQRNASRILDKGALRASANVLCNPPGPLLDDCNVSLVKVFQLTGTKSL